MNVADPTLFLFRNSTHFCAVLMVSTTMWSRAPHAVDMATSYCSSIPPRSPYELKWHEMLGTAKIYRITKKKQGLEMEEVAFLHNCDLFWFLFQIWVQDVLPVKKKKKTGIRNGRGCIFAQLWPILVLILNLSARCTSRKIQKVNLIWLWGALPWTHQSSLDSRNLSTTFLVHERRQNFALTTCWMQGATSFFDLHTCGSHLC